MIKNFCAHCAIWSKTASTKIKIKLALFYHNLRPSIENFSKTTVHHKLQWRNVRLFHRTSLSTYNNTGKHFFLNNSSTTSSLEIVTTFPNIALVTHNTVKHSSNDRRGHELYVHSTKFTTHNKKRVSKRVRSFSTRTVHLVPHKRYRK